MSAIIGNDPTGKQELLDNLAIVDGYTEKIDNLAVDGLSGVEDSLAYKTEKMESHIHNYEKWFGLAGTPAAETHRADRMDGAIAAFTLTAGNNDFGSWLQVFGSSDTPVALGKTKFDLHRILVTDTNSTRPFIIQIVTGESAGIAAKLSAEDFDEFPYVAATNNNDSGITELIDKRTDAGEKVWMRCADVGGNGTTLELYIGIHEYDR